MQTSSTQHRIVIIDDHGIVRHGIGVLLSAEPDLKICGEAGSYEEGLATLAQQQPDVAVIDLILHERSGLDLIREIRQKGWSMPIVVLSMHDEATHAEKSLRAGAQGYVMKEDADEVLVEAIRRVLAGGVYVSGDVNARILRTYAEGESEVSASGVEALTEREKEIFACVGRGLTTRKIAEQFGLSARTVEVHRARIKKKMQCEDAAQLFREAVKWVESNSP